MGTESTRLLTLDTAGRNPLCVTFHLLRAYCIVHVASLTGRRFRLPVQATSTDWLIYKPDLRRIELFMFRSSKPPAAAMDSCEMPALNLLRYVHGASLMLVCGSILLRWQLLDRWTATYN